MPFLNEYDIDRLYSRFHYDPLLGPAVETLECLRIWTNANSDGWAYWPKPSRAAAKLQNLLYEADRYERTNRREGAWPTKADVKKAYTPIRAFLTRQIRAGKYVTPGIIVEVPK